MPPNAGWRTFFYPDSTVGSGIRVNYYAAPDQHLLAGSAPKCPTADRDLA